MLMGKEESDLFLNDVNSCAADSSTTSFFSASDPFEAAFSSATGNANAINPNGTANVLRELIDPRFCNSNSNSNFPSVPADRGFALRAAMFSCFPNPNPIAAAVAVQESRGGLSRCSTPENVEINDSRENSSVSDIIPLPIPNSRKRKSVIPKGKQTPSPSPSPRPGVKEAHLVALEISESGSKRSKQEDGNEKEKTKASSSKDNVNANSSEAPKDYIHVRARRGQATDAHSLAERVRREKITERMKVLQDLVPGCNKVTGKAVMLDEIINYVQSLQRQVEFLSMKLATVNPRIEEMNMEGVASSKDVFECHGGSLPQHNMYQQPYPLESYQYLHSQPQYLPVHNNTVIPEGASTLNSSAGFLPGCRNQGALQLQLAPMDNYSEITANFIDAQVSSTLWEEDLQSFVQMGFGRNAQRASNSSHGGGIQMKVEL